MADEGVTETHERASGSGVAELQLRPGTRLGRYQLLVRHAVGGMGEVWIARQLGELGFSRVVALKTIRADRAEESSFRKMFLDEAKVAARLRHTNVVAVIDLGEHGRDVYLAMTYVEGDSLRGLIDRYQKVQRSKVGLPTPIALRIITDATTGLHAAHELTDDGGTPLNLVHRDVSPQNILVGMDGIAKLTDFGIAKALGRLTEETDSGQVKGKLSYLSPEQLGQAPVDRRSDVFAMGIVLWETLTGERLFRGDAPTHTMILVASKAVPDPRDFAEVPDAVAEVTLRALQRDVGNRYPTAEALADALDAAARESGVLASAKDVGAFVKEQIGNKVELRRNAIRSASSGISVGAEAIADPAPVEAVSATTGVAVLPHETERSPQRARFVAGALALTVATTAAALLLGGGDEAQVAQSEAATIAAGLAIQPSEPASAPAPSSAPSASAAASPSVSAEATSTVAPEAVPPARKPWRRKAKYDNPYNR